MSTLHEIAVTIEHIFISPGRNYFIGRPKDGPGTHPTFDVDQAEARAGLGLVGDRNYGIAVDSNAQISFVSAEVFAALQAEFDRGDLSPALMRRNVVLRGAPLLQLIDRTFSLRFGEGEQSETIEFLGTEHCAPCEWMEAMLGPGALRFLRGRGGLRGRILNDGIIRRGPATLITDFAPDMSVITTRLRRPKLPG